MTEKPSNIALMHHFSLEDIEVDAIKNTISKGSEEYSVEPRLIRIIARLAQSYGETVERSVLLKEISERVTASDESLTQAISKIRQLLEDDPKKPKFLKTVPRKGYLLLVPPVPITDENENLDQEQRDESIIALTKKKPWPEVSAQTIAYGAVLIVILTIIAVAFWPEETTFNEKREIEFIEKEV